MSSSALNPSILGSVKGCIGPYSDQNEFDNEICMYINGRLHDLEQITGFKVPEGFMVVDDTATWDDLCSHENYCDIMEYITQKCRERFDPPANSALLQALKDAIAECEFRLQVRYDR